MQKTLSNLSLTTCLALGFALTAASGASLSIPGPGGDTADRTAAAAAQFGKLPLMFETARGTAGNSGYLAHGPGYSVLIEPNGARLSLSQPAPGDPQKIGKGAKSAPRAGRSIGLSFDGSAAGSDLVGEETLPSKINYLIGNDPSKWSTGLATYGKVRSRNVYPGIDVVYYGNQRQLEFDMVVAPGANPAQIAMSFSGADKIEISSSGDAAVHLGNTSIIQRKPVAYQMVAGKRIEVPASYILENSTLRFQIGRFDSKCELIIDPLLNYTTYLGGLGQDIGWAIAVDSAGNAYIAGDAESYNFPVTNGINQTVSLGGVNTNYNGTNFSGTTTIGGDAFVAKLNPSGTAFAFVTYLGGSGHDIAFGLKQDSTGIYVGGITSSPNFPIVNGCQTNIAGTAGEFLNAYPFDGFVAKLGPNGTNLLYSTYFGGSGQDEIFAIDITARGNIYATGLTTSTDITTNFPGAYQPALTNATGSSLPDAFIACFNPNAVGTPSLIHFTYLGGTGDDEAEAIVVDHLGNVLITGLTLSSDFNITTNIHPAAIANYSGTNIVSTYTGTVRAGDYDAFVSKFDSTLSTLTYSFYLGGGAQDYGYAIAVDSANNAYITGQTKSFDFPIMNSVSAHGGIFGTLDAWVTEISSDGSAVLFSTYLGGVNDDIGWAIAVDKANYFYVAGQTASLDFPLVGSGTNNSFTVGPVAFVTRFKPGGTSVDYSTFLGGSGTDIAYAIAVDDSLNIYVTGQTTSLDLLSNTNNATNLFYVNQSYPVSAQTNFAGTSDAFITKLSIPPQVSTQTTTSGGSTTLTLTWITSLTSYVLQFSSSPTGPWTDDTTDVPVQTGSTYTVTISNPATPVFYRLRRSIPSP